jgi:heterodisulfide reductase subunit B
MVALALGCSPEEIGLNYHVQKATHILEEAAQ